MKVFFAVDGSPESIAAVRQVGQLMKSEVDSAALYFAPPEVVVRFTATAKEMQERAHHAISTAVFEEACPFLPEPLGAKARKITTSHLPREGILYEAAAWGADLIVIGARGLSGFDRVLLGSVSQGVAHRSMLPVLVSRAASEQRGEHPFRVLFAYDGSTSAEAALQVAQQLTFPPRTEVFAMTVVEPLPGELPDWLLQAGRSPETLEMIAAWQRETEADKRRAHDRLAEFMSRQRAPFNRAEVLAVAGGTAEQIINVAESRRIDLVVVGSHGKGMLQRTFLGSTSDKVLRHAPCSVLIARSKSD